MPQTKTQSLAVKAYFEKGYIAHPYWPEMAKLIDIQKSSGVNRAKSDKNRREALEQYLKSKSMTLADYEKLMKQAAEPFYRKNGGVSEIVIPVNQVLSFLVAANDEARSRTRCCEPDQVRSRFTVTPWTTGKSKSDGTWERFVTVTAGTGAKLSNQRGFRSNEYISDFTAEGTISFNPDFVSPDALKALIIWGGENVGLGACRKMGWGRFELK